MRVPGAAAGQPHGDNSHPKTGSLCFVCSAWKMAVLEAKSTPVRLHPPKQGHHPGTGLGQARVEVTPT